MQPRGSFLKTRTIALVILVVSLILASYTGFHLKQALDAEHELRAQMGDLSLVTMTDASAPSGAVSLGEASLRGALAEVRQAARHDEAFLALEAAGVLAGFFLLRRSLALNRVQPA